MFAADQTAHLTGLGFRFDESGWLLRWPFWLVCTPTITTELRDNWTDLVWIASNASSSNGWQRWPSPSVLELWNQSTLSVNWECCCLGSELTMRQHIINHVVSIGYDHLRRLRLLRRHIIQDARVKQLVCSLILSWIEYCNAILIGQPVSSTAPLQCLQNSAARLVMGLRVHDHVMPRPYQVFTGLAMGLRALVYVTSALFQSSLASNIYFRIQYKVAFMMFFIHTNQCHAYLGNIVTQPLHNNHLRQRICSSSGSDYQIPRMRTTLGERSLSVAGPNTSPVTLYLKLFAPSPIKRPLTVCSNSLFNITFKSSEWHYNASSIRRGTKYVINYYY